MNEQTIQAIQKTLAPIAEKIGQGAQYGWEIVVRQQLVYGALGIAWGVFGLVLGFVVYLVYKAELKKDDPWYELPPTLFVVFGGIVALVSIIVGSGVGITHLLNPAYYALDFFIHLGGSSN